MSCVDPPESNFKARWGRESCGGGDALVSSPNLVLPRGVLTCLGVSFSHLSYIGIYIYSEQGKRPVPL